MFIIINHGNEALKKLKKHLYTAIRSGNVRVVLEGMDKWPAMFHLEELLDNCRNGNSSTHLQLIESLLLFFCA